MANYQDQSTGSAIYYHCFVKICDAASTDCSATLVINLFLIFLFKVSIQLDGTTATDCTSTGTVNAAPAAARRRRSADQEIRAEDITSTKVNVAPVKDCEERDDCFVYGRSTETENNEEEKKTENEDDDSSALAATSAVAAVVLAVFN